MGVFPGINLLTVFIIALGFQLPLNLAMPTELRQINRRAGRKKAAIPRGGLLREAEPE